MIPMTCVRPGPVTTAAPVLETVTEKFATDVVSSPSTPTVCVVIVAGYWPAGNEAGGSWSVMLDQVTLAADVFESSTCVSGGGSGELVASARRTDETAETAFAFTASVASAPVATVMAIHVLDALANAPREIVPDTPPAVGIAVVCACVDGYKHPVATAAESTVGELGVEPEEPPHATSEPLARNEATKTAARKYAARLRTSIGDHTLATSYALMVWARASPSY